MALPLEGINVVDFGWVGVGPLTTRYLAYFGATVVRIESETRLDTMRLSPPFKDGLTQPDRSGPFIYWNMGKWSMALNMRTGKGVALARRLILEWADVVVENFTAGVMGRWGLDYEALAEEKPRLIMLSVSTFGRRNPLSGQPGYGPLLAPFCGINHLTGWPDRVPLHPGPFGAYTDLIIPRMAAFSLIAALDYRARTSRGMHIDMAQYEASLQLIAPLIMDYIETGRDGSRAGNSDPGMAPHGIYPCEGKDRWIAVAVTSEEEWQAFRQVMDNPAWAQEPRFDTLMDRKAHEEELNTHIARWTGQQKAERLMERLQQASVPAGVVNSNSDLFQDPQLKHRCLYPEVEHVEIGRHHVEAPELRLSKTPYRIQRSGPLLGEHSYPILHDVLELTDEEIAALIAEGVVH